MNSLNPLPPKRARELVDHFNHLKILVVGDVVLDHYVHGIVERLNPEASVPLLDVVKEQQLSGGGGNVAKNAALLGVKTTLISVVGADAAAEQLERIIRLEKYKGHLLPDPTRPTIRKVRFLAGSQPLLRVDYETRHDISADLEKVVLSYVAAALKDGCDGLLISDYAKGVITANVARQVIATAHQHDVPVAADVKPTRAPDIVGATFISPNLKEAKAFLGLEQDTKASFAQIADKLHKKFKTTACLTLGPEGLYVVGDDQPGTHIPQEHVREVYDVSGAGDTVITVLLLARLAGATYVEAGQLANAAAAVVISKVGTVGATAEEIVGMIAHHHE